MLTSEEILDTAAQGGSIDLEHWPRVLDDLLKRLHDIVHNEFPIPSVLPPSSGRAIIDPEVVASTPPRLPTSESNPHEQASGDTDTEPATNSQSSTKENDTPADIALTKRERTKMPASTSTHLDVSTSQRTEEMPSPEAHRLSPKPGTLPPELLSLYQTSTRILQNDFAHSPPYTIQRLSEMVLQPKRFYRYLPAYLRALDRIVSVSSPVSDFPLPTLHASTNGGFLTNGEAPVNGITERESLGSDESLGGALLTPIPWLVNQNSVLNPTSSDAPDGEIHGDGAEHVDGAHLAGSGDAASLTTNGVHGTPTTSQPQSSPITSPTLSEQSDASTSSASSSEAQLREQGGVTQGELLRQEQEAGVVPVDASGQPMTPRRHLISSGAIAVGRDPIAPNPHAPAPTADLPLDDELPHARGPHEIGMEDMGPQQTRAAGTLDLEAAVGRSRSKSPQAPPASTSTDDAMEEEEEEQKPDSVVVAPTSPVQRDRDPQDVEKDVAKLKEVMDQTTPAAAAAPRDADGDVIVADAEDQNADHTTGRSPGADAGDNPSS